MVWNYYNRSIVLVLLPLELSEGLGFLTTRWSALDR